MGAICAARVPVCVPVLMSWHMPELRGAKRHKCTPLISPCFVSDFFVSWFRFKLAACDGK